MQEDIAKRAAVQVAAGFTDHQTLKSVIAVIGAFTEKCRFYRDSFDRHEYKSVHRGALYSFYLRSGPCGSGQRHYLSLSVLPAHLALSPGFELVEALDCLRREAGPATKIEQPYPVSLIPFGRVKWEPRIALQLRFGVLRQTGPENIGQRLVIGVEKKLDLPVLYGKYQALLNAFYRMKAVISVM